MNNNTIKKIKVLSFGPALNVKGGISIIEKLIITHLPDNVSMKHIPTTIDGNKLTKIFYFIYAVVRTFVNAPNYDIFHIHFASRGSTFRKIIICYIGLIFRKKIIMHANGAEFHLFYNNIPDFYRKLIKSVFLKIDILISLSEKWMLYFKSTFKIENNKLVILHNPVKIIIDDLLPKENTSMKLVFLGRIGKRKGAYDLINAIYKIINNKKIDIKLIMAGDGEVETARSLVESLNIAEYIEVRDWVDEAERNKLLKSSDIFVLPSYNEGLPMSLLEAMSFGLAVITTPVGGIPDVIKNLENGIFVEPGDVSGLVNAIELLLQDGALRFKLQKESFENVKYFDINNYIKKLVNIYESIL